MIVRVLGWLICGILFLGLGACAGPNVPQGSFADEAGARQRAAALQTSLADSTRLFAKGGLANTFSAYLAADGGAAYWISGNTALLSGLWSTSVRRIEECESVKAPPIYNPATKQMMTSIGYRRVCQTVWYPYVCFDYGQGRPPECLRAHLYVMLESDRAAGDPLGLSAGRLPFVLPRQPGSLPGLVAKVQAAS